jgi:membrane-associated phospholipid phosphatase
MLWLFCAGHIIYLMTPGYGPVIALSHQFTTELPRGLWYDMVMSTVSSAGAQMDIFPSLHTAAPVFLTLFSYRYRARLPFRYTWPVVGFFSVNIIIATMYLRWHWVIDIVAGIVHGAGALSLAQLLTARELRRREARGFTPSWPRFQEARTSRSSRPSHNPKNLKAA